MSNTGSDSRIEEPLALVDAIAKALAGPEGRYNETVAADDPDIEARIALVRSCGRRAGRQLGIKVRTVAEDEAGVIRLDGMAIKTRRTDGRRDVQVINMQ